MKKLVLKYSVFCLLLVGCSAVNVDYNVPTGHFLSPESTGTTPGAENSTLNKIQTEFILQPVNKISIARVQQQFLWNDYTTDSDIAVTPTITIGVNAGVSISRRLDFTAKKCYDCPIMGGAKYQLIGSPENERQRGHKMAIAAFGGLFHEKEKSADVNSIDGKKAEKIESDTRILASEYHVIFGERLTESTLLFLDGFYTHHEVQTEIIRQGGQKLDRNSNLDNFGGDFGVRFSSSPKESRPEQTHLTIQGGLTKTAVFGSKKESRNLGASLGFTW